MKETIRKEMGNKSVSVEINQAGIAMISSIMLLLGA